jgi:hypothetical protein
VRLPPLFASLARPRRIWLPTFRGWLLILAAIGLPAFLLLRNAYPLLAVQEPVPGARILVVEGWLGTADLDQAIAAFRRGRYERVVTTGGPMESWAPACTWASYADRGASYLRARGLVDVPLDAVPAPQSMQERTFLSAVMLREWLQRSGVRADAIDLYSAGVHARRSRLLFQMALGPQTQVGVMAATPGQYDPNRWWASSAGAKTVLDEVISMAWTKCCFWPPAAGSHEERWAVPRKAPA